MLAHPTPLTLLSQVDRTMFMFFSPFSLRGATKNPAHSPTYMMGIFDASIFFFDGTYLLLLVEGWVRWVYLWRKHARARLPPPPPRIGRYI